MRRITKIATKFLLSFFVFLILVFSFVSSAHAQSQTGNWYNQSFPEWYTKVYDTSNPSEIFGERYTAAQIQWVVYGLFSFIINSTNNSDALNCLFTKQINECVDALKKSFPSSVSTPTSSPGFFQFLAQDRPLSGISYFKQAARNWHLIPEASAQATPGFGFSTLDPILPLWRAARNISFTLFVVLILILAFMIMFRVKISPQTVISVQSALPKVAIALILVTFSYAIAGFLVDLMYVFIGLIGLLISASFANTPVINNPTTWFSWLTFGFLHTGVFGFLVMYLILFPFALLAALIGMLGPGGFLAATIGTLGIAPTLMFILTILATVILVIVAIFVGFKIVWMLIKALANILLLTIFAPFQIALGTVIPNFGFGSWLKSFVSNLIIFPATGLLFTLSFIFLWMAILNVTGLQNSVFSGQFWSNFFITLFPVLSPLGNTGWPPLLGVGDKMIGVIYVGVSLSVLFIIPKTMEMIQSFIQGKPFAFGTAIGEAAGPIGYVGGLAKGAVEKGTIGYLGAGIQAGLERRLGALTGEKTIPPGVEPPPG